MMGKLRTVWENAARWTDKFLWNGGRRRKYSLVCVGLIVLAGCLALVIAPDPDNEEAPMYPNAVLPTVVIDAGHGGKDEGAKCRGVQEKLLTLDVALRLEHILKARGFSIVQTRTDDVFVSLSERSVIANRVNDPAVFVSIHFNQGSARDIAGIETFYADSKVPIVSDWTWIGIFAQPEQRLDSGAELAREVQRAVVLRTGARDRGIRARHLYVTRHTRIPAILVEGGFITNKMESQLINDDDYAYADHIAEGIADGIEAWWRAKRKAAPPRMVRKM